MLAQVITHHKMDIIVSEGNVISAVTDDTWDELNHQYVLKPQSKLPSHDKPVSSFEGTVTDYASLIAAIESRGILVQHRENIPAESSTFSVPIEVISVGGSDVQVFEFKDGSEAIASSLTVSEDGTEIGTSIIRWMDTPHFYTKGNLIVLYVGQNPEITNLLESLLGNQFAGM
jgi:exosome complex RNA-binding protein Csl4